MSCVDAAIIKALVEHIGMDPEDVPIGGGSTGGSHAEEIMTMPDKVIKTFEWVKWSQGGYNYPAAKITNSDLPESTLNVGDILRLKNYDGSNTYIDYIVSVVRGGEIVMTKFNGHSVIMEVREDSQTGITHWVLLDGAIHESRIGVENILPDNTNTGFFRPTYKGTTWQLIRSVYNFVNWVRMKVAEITNSFI